ncbi:MAG: B12-binding domain-containing protein, partial [Promethearchaeota archaeon]
MIAEILKEITLTTIKGEYKKIGRLVRKALRQNISHEEIVNSLSRGLIEITEKYKKKGMYLDDIILSAAAFEVGFQSLKFPKEQSK